MYRHHLPSMSNTLTSVTPKLLDIDNFQTQTHTRTTPPCPPKRGVRGTCTIAHIDFFGFFRSIFSEYFNTDEITMPKKPNHVVAKRIKPPKTDDDFTAFLDSDRSTVLLGQTWLDLNIVFDTISEGSTIADLSRVIEVPEATVYRWFRRYPIFRATFEHGRDYLAYWRSIKVEDALYDDAVNSEGKAIGSQRFWLSNRKADNWRERQDRDSRDNGITIVVNTGIDRTPIDGESDPYTVNSETSSQATLTIEGDRQKH